MNQNSNLKWVVFLNSTECFNTTRTIFSPAYNLRVSHYIFFTLWKSSRNSRLHLFLIVWQFHSAFFFVYGDHIQRATQLSRTFEYTTLRTNLWSQTVSFRLNEIVNDCLLWYLILWCCYRTNLQTGFTTARGKCFSQLENQNSVTANVYTIPPYLYSVSYSSVL